MSFLKELDFNKRFVTSPIAKIVNNPKHILPANLTLPRNSVIHFIADSDQQVGIDSSYSLLRNAGSQVYIYHVLDLVHKVGNISSTHLQVKQFIRNYHKTHLSIRPISNLDRSLSNNPAPIVMNYSLLPRLNKYNANTLIVYQEWFNIRATMWDMVNQIGGRREHFIRYQLPEILPPKNDLIRYAEAFKASGLGEFHDANTLNILELWRMVSLDVDSAISSLSAEAIEHVNLVFSESGVLVILRLRELLEWVQEDHAHAASGFYRFLDGLIGLRTPVETADVVTKDQDDSSAHDLPDHDTITKLIKEQGSVGALSEAEQKGLHKLAQRYKTIHDPHGSGVTIDKMVVTKDDLVVDRSKLIADSDNIHDKSMLESSIQELDKSYVKNVLHKDIMQSILMLHPAGVIVKDVKVKTKNSAVTKADTYSVHVQPINGAASTINFTIPVINEDGTFMSGGVKYRMDKQKGELPIVKSKPNVVALTSYYGKIFVTRNDSSAANFSKWLLKEIFVRSNNKDDESITNLVYGINKVKGVKLPRAYTAICESVNSFTVNNKYHLLFVYNKLSELFTDAELAEVRKHGLVPCGYTMNDHYLLGMDVDGNIHVIRNGSTENLYSIPYLIDPEMGEGPIEYTEFSILNRRMPLILAFTYMFGLDEALKKLGVSFTLSATNVRLPPNRDEFRLKFKDIVYVINISNKYVRLLIGGFSAIKNDVGRYKGSDFNKQQSYSSLLASLGLTNYHLRELKLMWDMYIEPITKGLLEEMGEPTNFYDLLLRASEMLVDDHVPDVNSSRYKGYERLCGMMYHELVVAMRAHRAQGSLSNVGVSMNPQAVWLNIVQDQSIALVEESNPIHNLKEHESYTHAGSGGRSAVTMVKSTRGFTKDDLGVVSESTPDSQKVGIRAYLSANPNIVSLRGTTRAYDADKDGASSVISSSALLSPAITHDDGKRVNFISVQHSHGVACDGYEALPYRTGYEEVVGARVDELFVVTAEADGVVVSVKPDSLTVEYDGGIKKVYEIGIRHGTVTGVTIPHTRTTDMKAGQHFKKGTALVFNSGFFTRSELNPANVVYKAGVVSRVALLENSDTIEDGCVISTNLASKLSTRGTTLHGVIVDFNTVIHNLVRVGDVVDPETILCSLETYIGDDLSAKDAEAIRALNRIAANNPKAKVYGKVSNIEVLYYGNIQDMHFSLQQVANQYDDARAKKIRKLMLDDAKTGKIDESIRVAGKKLVANQIAIKIYIDGDISMGAGDKLVFGNALKSTCSRVSTDEMVSKDGQAIDALFGYQSVSDRIVCSPEISGIMNTVMKELSRQMGKRFKR